jgi:hypothetical protein
MRNSTRGFIRGACWWRHGGPGLAKIQCNGGRYTRTRSAKPEPFGALRFVRKGLVPNAARETLSVLLDDGGTASP